MGKLIKLIQTLHEQNVASSFINKLYKIIERYNIYGEENIDLKNSNIVGEVTMANPVYKEEVDEIRTHFPNLIVHADDYYVKFEDPNAEAACVQLWGDGIGVSQANLAAVKSIPAQAFGPSTGIEHFPEFKYFTNVTTITNEFVQGNNAGSNTVLKSLVLPESVTQIGYTTGGIGGFIGCSALESVTIPDNCTIKAQTFRYCTSLRNIILGNGCSIGWGTFMGCSTLESIDLNGCTYLDTNAFNGCDALTSIVIPNTVTFVGNECFDESITSIIFEEENDDNPLILGIQKDTIWKPGVFKYQQNMTITLPKRLSELRGQALGSSKGTNNYIFKSTIPPTITPDDNNNYDLGYIGTGKFYVPDESVQAYKEAEHWSAYADIIFPVSEYQNN